MRYKLLLIMLALSVMLALVVTFGSPYAPVVAPMVDIEQIWAMEDTRAQSAEPLVTALENHGVPLVYDRERNTFFCTLGMDCGDTWPQMHLTAPGTGGVQMFFVDDYSYDSCADALMSGYPYQVFACTDTEFQYFDVVFTGLPLVQIECHEEITRMDTPMEIIISSAGSEPVRSSGRMHLRGGTTMDADKKNYRIEFTRSAQGGKTPVNLPALGLRSDMLLNAMAFDRLLVRERLTWDIYGQAMGGENDNGFGARECAYTEVFLNGEYLGLYLMMDPINAREEVQKAGDAHLLTDSVYRTVRMNFVDDRPVIQDPTRVNSTFELHYEPGKPFSGIERYIDLITERDEAEIKRKAEACMDIESVVRYCLLRQFGGLADNVSNNLYLWNRQTPEGMRYQMALWDLDLSWGRKYDTLGEQYDHWMAFTVIDQMMLVNAGGINELMVQRWRQWRETFCSPEYVQELLNGYYQEMIGSGAIVRNAERWGLSIDDTCGYEIVWFAQQRAAAIDHAMTLIEENDGNPIFIKDIYSDPSTYPVYNPQADNI